MFYKTLWPFVTSFCRKFSKTSRFFSVVHARKYLANFFCSICESSSMKSIWIMSIWFLSENQGLMATFSNFDASVDTNYNFSYSCISFLDVDPFIPFTAWIIVWSNLHRIRINCHINRVRWWQDRRNGPRRNSQQDLKAESGHSTHFKSYMVHIYIEKVSITHIMI